MSTSPAGVLARPASGGYWQRSWGHGDGRKVTGVRTRLTGPAHQVPSSIAMAASSEPTVIRDEIRPGLDPLLAA
ncbi:MAG: hypothetical protein ACM3ML_05720 [Micromonosporaceae bacterium]